jgi:hypothetical protein
MITMRLKTIIPADNADASSELELKALSDGAFLLRQGEDLVYVSAAQARALAAQLAL